MIPASRPALWRVRCVISVPAFPPVWGGHGAISRFSLNKEIVMSHSVKDKKQRPHQRLDASLAPLGPSKQTEITLPKDLIIVLTPHAFGQLFGFAQATDLEVSLLGIVDRDGSTFTVREFFLVPQKGAYSHTETDPAAIGELIERLMMEGRSDDAKNLRCWAHSHPGMDVFWSHTDDDNCRRLCSDWLVSIVVSDGFRVRCRLDVASPIPATFDWLAVYCDSPVDAAIAEQCKREVKEKIKPMPFLGFGKANKHGKKGTHVDKPQDVPIELIEYCGLCGGWHAEEQCPMELESSAYELARQERADAPEDDVWF